MSINAKTQSLFFVFVAVWAAFVVDQSFAFNARILTKQFIPNSVGLDQIIRSPSSSSSDYKTKVSTISSKSPNTKTKKNTSQQLHGEYVIGGAGSISTTTVTATQPPLPLPTIDTNTKGLVLPKFVGNVCSILRIDVDKIANVGVSFALTYSIISNINGSISLSLAWYISSNQVRHEQARLCGGRGKNYFDSHLIPLLVKSNFIAPTLAAFVKLLFYRLVYHR